MHRQETFLNFCTLCVGEQCDVHGEHICENLLENLLHILAYVTPDLVILIS